jgi:hypothetical protein
VINRENFLVKMDQFQKFFNREIEDEFLMDYYEILSEELNDAEFEFACKKVFRHEKFFPTPQNFLDHAKGSLDYQALDAWENKFSDELDESGKFALSSLGGKSAIARSENIEFMRKDFLSAYKAHKTAPPKAPKPALPQAPEPESYVPRQYTEEDLTWLEKAREADRLRTQEADRLRTQEAVRKCKEKLGIK